MDLLNLLTVLVLISMAVMTIPPGYNCLLRDHLLNVFKQSSSNYDAMNYIDAWPMHQT